MGNKAQTCQVKTRGSAWTVFRSTCKTLLHPTKATPQGDLSYGSLPHVHSHLTRGTATERPFHVGSLSRQATPAASSGVPLRAAPTPADFPILGLPAFQDNLMMLSFVQPTRLLISVRITDISRMMCKRTKISLQIAESGMGKKPNCPALVGHGCLCAPGSRGVGVALSAWHSLLTSATSSSPLWLS